MEKTPDGFGQHDNVIPIIATGSDGCITFALHDSDSSDDTYTDLGSSNYWQCHNEIETTVVRT